MATAPDAGRPTFVLRASRQVALAGQPILLTAALEGGEEVEAFYCPTVVWMWADGTESGSEGDCPAFEQREAYPRRWTRWVGLSVPGQYVIGVRLEKAGRVMARATLTLIAAGGE